MVAFGYLCGEFKIHQSVFVMNFIGYFSFGIHLEYVYHLEWNLCCFWNFRLDTLDHLTHGSAHLTQGL